MDTSNWAKAEAARVQAVSDAAEREIRERTDACNAREPRLPAPTMTRCSFRVGHVGPHSFAVVCPVCESKIKDQQGHPVILIDIHNLAYCLQCGHEFEV